ncbi:hypothetical protein K474DRAFT_1713030 [Panus rudis PR-1116 ss-1]|nr:hypothetical protein K474DRAFT_1713030 [Panus rudis PR-1116 ss-1]
MAAPNQSIDLTNLVLFLRTIEANNTLAHQHLQQATEQVSRIIPALTTRGQVNVADAQGRADLAFTYVENARELTILNQYNLAEYLVFFRVTHPELSIPATVPMNLHWIAHLSANQSPSFILEDPNNPATAPPPTYHNTVRQQAREYSQLLGTINPDGSIRHLPQPPHPRPTHLLSELYTSDQPRLTHPIQLQPPVRHNETRAPEQISTGWESNSSHSAHHSSTTRTPSSGAWDEDLNRLEGVPIEDHIRLLTEYIHACYPVSNNASPTSTGVRDPSPESPFHDVLVIARMNRQGGAHSPGVLDLLGTREHLITVASSPKQSPSPSPR